MKNLIKILIASTLVLGVTALASASSSAFGGSLNHPSVTLLASASSSAFGG